MPQKKKDPAEFSANVITAVVFLGGAGALYWDCTSPGTPCNTDGALSTALQVVVGVPLLLGAILGIEFLWDLLCGHYRGTASDSGKGSPVTDDALDIFTTSPSAHSRNWTAIWFAGACLVLLYFALF